MIDRRIRLLLACSAAAIFASGAVAQTVGVDATGGGSGLDEIVVTAQKRAENVQDVPIAIAAFGGEAIQQRGISDVSQLSSITPSVVLDAGTPFAGSGAALGATIRGIGQNDFAVNVDPGVGVYLDGIYLARTVGANVALPDVERVEVLKGPQGTLFGRNTIGGAINIVTHEPGDEFRFKGSVTTGRFERLDVAGTADIPLSETLKSSITFASNHRDGFVKRVPYTQAGPYVQEPNTLYREVGYDSSNREGGVGDWSLRGKLKWEAAPSLKVTVTGDYYKQNTSGLPNIVLDVLDDFPGDLAGPGAPLVPGSALTPGTGYNFAGLYNFCINSTPAQIMGRNAQSICGPRGTELDPSTILPALGGANVDADPSNNRLPYDDRWVSRNWNRSYATGNSFARSKTWGLSGALDWTLSPDITLRSITGYREMEWASGFDGDNSPINFLHVSNSAKQHQFSQEFQLVGDTDKLGGKLNYVLGAYYFSEKGSEDGFVTIGTGLLQIEGPIDVKNRNVSFFGQLDWRVSDLLGFTLGGRYTSEKKAFDAQQTDYAGFNYDLFNCPVTVAICPGILGFPDPNDPLRVYPPNTPDRKFHNFSPKFGVQLHPNDDVMVYGSYTMGYKVGGWSTRLQNPTATAPTFDDEKAKTLELGLKSTLLDRRLRFNAAVFRTIYDNIQLLFQRGTNPLIENAGKATIKGAEADLTASINEYLSLTMSAGYLDAKLTEVIGPTGPDSVQLGTSVGARLPKVPKFTFNLSPRVTLPVGAGDAKLVFQGDYTHTSSMWNDAQRTFLLKRPTTDVFNASLTFQSGGNWSVTLGGTNLSNERYVVNGVAQKAGGLVYGSPNRPREWYARLGIEF